MHITYPKCYIFILIFNCINIRKFLYKYQSHNSTVSSIKFYHKLIKTLFNDGERVFKKKIQ